MYILAWFLSCEDFLQNRRGFIRRARYSLFEMKIPSILIWQILRFDPKDMKLQFELEFEFPFGVII
jgi:hypothetical protein